jgi:hypothetical protein
MLLLLLHACAIVAAFLTAVRKIVSQTVIVLQHAGDSGSSLLLTQYGTNM